MTLGHLAGMSTLEALDIGFVQFTDSGLENLTLLPNLRELTIGGNKLTDAGLWFLRQLPQLTYLDISGAQRTDSGLWSVSITGGGRRLSRDPERASRAPDERFAGVGPMDREAEGAAKA